MTGGACRARPVGIKGRSVIIAGIALPLVVTVAAAVLEDRRYPNSIYVRDKIDYESVLPWGGYDWDDVRAADDFSPIVLPRLSVGKTRWGERFRKAPLVEFGPVVWPTSIVCYRGVPEDVRIAADGSRYKRFEREE